MIADLTIDGVIFPCYVIESPNFENADGEPIALRWQLSYRSNDAGYRAIHEAYYRGTYCDLEMAENKGIISEFQSYIASENSGITVEFTFSELAIVSKPIKRE